MQKGEVGQIIPVELGRDRANMRAVRTSAEYSRKRTMIWEALHDHDRQAA
jgi:NitT/TauT family transport system ATP-binding protein